MTAVEPRPDLADLERPALESALEARGHKRFHARQIFRWIYKHGVTDVDAMTDLSRELRETLSSEFALTTSALAHRDISADGTQKFLLRLADGRHIESVFIPDTPANTFCISTQVGCAMACAFCLTGRMGLGIWPPASPVRSLFWRARSTCATKFNIVLMGVGGAANYDETMAWPCADEPAAFPRITLSAVGLPRWNAGREPVPNLAIAARADRPAGASWCRSTKCGVADIIAARDVPVEPAQPHHLSPAGRDTAGHAKAAKLVAGVKSKVNLIPLNAAPGIPFERPSDEVIDRFAKIVADHGVTVSVRKSRGRDIRAACGQLIVEGPRKSAAQQLAVVM
jgi:23S rRNA (adenine2503-C2)-methyltransferase